MPVWRKPSLCSILVSNHECSSALTLSSCIDMILFEGLVLSLSNRDRDGSSIVKGKKCKSAVNSKPAGRRPRRHSVMHYFINFLPRLDWQDEMCIQATKARLETGSCREEVWCNVLGGCVHCTIYAKDVHKFCTCSTVSTCVSNVPELCIGCA